MKISMPLPLILKGINQVLQWSRKIKVACKDAKYSKNKFI